MYNFDLAVQLREALTLSGCTAEQIGQFDSYSTIELAFTDLPSLNIALSGEAVWCWSDLGPFNASQRTHYSERLLSFLLEGFTYARTGQLQLMVTDELLQVRVLLGSEALADPRGLADAIDAYVERLLVLRELLR